VGLFQSEKEKKKKREKKKKKKGEYGFDGGTTTNFLNDAVFPNSKGRRTFFFIISHSSTVFFAILHDKKFI
jgi:hypothetical protein